MKTKRPGRRKPCKFPAVDAEGSFEEDPSINAQSNPSVARLSIASYNDDETPNSYGDTNISSSGEQSAYVEPTYENSQFGHGFQGGHSDDPNNWCGQEGRSQSQLHQLHLSSSYGKKCSQSEQGSYQCQTSTEPSSQQLLLPAADDIIDLTSSDEEVPSPSPEDVCILLSSSHLQKVIREYSCSQPLVDSVLRCTQSKCKQSGGKINAIDKNDGLRIMTSHNSQPQAGEDKEAYIGSTIPVESTVGTSKRGPKRRRGGKASSQEKLTVKTRTRKDGCSGNEAAVTASEMGKNKQINTHPYNLAPHPCNLGGPSCTGAEAMEIPSAEVPELRERLASLEHTCAQMAAEMITMQKKLADKDGVPTKPSQARDVSADSGVLASTSAQGVPSDKGLERKS